MTPLAALAVRLAFAIFAAAPAPDGDDAAGPLLEVRSAKDDALVVNAEVRFLDTGLGATTMPFTNDENVAGLLGRVEAHGAHLETHGDGRVRLPYFEHEALVLVRANRANGATGTSDTGESALLQLVAPCDPHLLLRLPPTREIVAEVRDVHGTPQAGVELRLFRSEYDFHDLLWRGRTGAGESAGRIRIELPQVVDGSGDSHRSSAIFASAACIVLPVPPRRPSWIAAVHDETTRIELRLPTTGALDVLVNEGAGPAPSSLVAAFAAPPGMPTLTDELLGSVLADPSVVSAEVKQGRASLPFVECGRSIALAWISPTRRPVVRVVAGPEKEGDVREATLDASAAPPLPVLQGVAADLHAAPLANRDVLLEILTTPPMFDDPSSPIRCDGSGAFSLVDPRGLLGRRVPFDRDVRLLARGASARDLLASAPVRMPAVGADGVCALGPLLLVPPPIWVEGRVVDGDGRPLDAQVELEPRDEDELGDKPSFARRRNWFMQTPPPASRPITGGWRVRCGADGRFALFGNPVSSALQIGVTHVGYHKSDFTVPHADPTAGSSPFVKLDDIVLERLATLHGRLVVDQGVPPSLFEIAASGSALRVEEPSRRRARDRRVADHDGSFSIAGLGAGALRWSIYATGESQPLRTGVFTIVPPTRDDAHRFLPPIDLAGALPLLHVKVAPAEPAPGLDASLSYRRSATEKWTAALGSLADGFVVPKTAPSFEAVVSVANHRMVRIADLSADREVAVPAGIPLRIAIAFEAELPPKARVRIALKPLLGASEVSDEEAPWNREVSEVVPCSAPRVRFTLSRDSAWHASVAVDPEGFGFPVDVKLTESHVEVADTDAEQELTLQVTAAQIDEALRRR